MVLKTSTITKHAEPKRMQTTTSGQVSKPAREKGKYADKYKYVRFVEQKKVLRKMRQLQKELLKGDISSRDKIEASLSELRKDLMYIEKFPGNEKYISLFPSEGQLSEECLAKQRKIRDMIVNVTHMRELNAEKRKLDAVKNDDFFASVHNVEKPSRETTIQETKKPDIEPKTKSTDVHPSWEAKKQNIKLTGSLAQTKFEGNRVVFEDD